MSSTLKEIFHENYASLCNYAAVMIKDKHNAEDIVQSVFIQLWENEKIFQLEHAETYLLKCVRYKCIDFLRSPQRHKTIQLSDLPNMGREDNHNLKEEEILPLLHFFTSKLPPKTQQVFLMSRNLGLTYKEIAKELNVSVKTVENQMGTALKKLRVLLKEHNYLPFLFIFFQ